MNTSKWPNRGKVSADGKYYSHTDGRVFEITKWFCLECSLVGTVECSRVVIKPCKGSPLLVIPDAYAPSDDELAACDMAMEMMDQCPWRLVRSHHTHPVGCGECDYLLDKTCPARVWLARCGQADAWEVAK